MARSVRPILRRGKEAAIWVVRLTDKQLDVLKALLRSEDHLGPALSRALASLELARWDELPEAELPWTEITEIAASQGVSEADVVWDLCGRRAWPGPAASAMSAGRRPAPAEPGRRPRGAQ